MKISLTIRAEKKYAAIINHIKDEWGDAVAEAFRQKTIDFMDLLKNFPELGLLEVPGKKIRGFQLTKQTRVFYRVKSERLIILTFFDVRQNPKKKLK